MLQAWRGLAFRRDRTSVDKLRMLDGIVEPFVHSLGKSLAEGPKRPDWAWAQTRGLLRLCSKRGAVALTEEFDVLRQALEQTLDALHGRALRPEVGRMVDAACRSACLQMQALARGAAASEVEFGGVVVEIFEPRPRLH